MIARLLEKEGVENYMILIGGEVVVKGVNQNGVCWRTGINLPEDDPDGIKNNYDEIVQLCKKGAIATSGNYRNFYIKDGKKYAHTIDPRTGYPAEQSVLSATIVANDCMTADAYATAFMAMGLEKARQMADSLPEIEYYVIYADENGNSRDVGNSYEAKALLSWELDLWGNLRWKKVAAVADYLQSVESQRALRMTIVAEVAQAYYELVALDTELEIVRQTQKVSTGAFQLYVVPCGKSFLFWIPASAFG